MFKWSNEARKDFNQVKVSIVNAPVLAHPNYKKYFIMHFYANEHTMSLVLLQTDENGSKFLIYFMSVTLKNHELRYLLTEKQAFSMVKAVKHF